MLGDLVPDFGGFRSRVPFFSLGLRIKTSLLQVRVQECLEKFTVGSRLICSV